MTLPIIALGPVARSRNGVIGRDGDLPWRLKTDLQIFKQVTLFKPVIMGRKTWDSLPKTALPAPAERGAVARRLRFRSPRARPWYAEIAERSAADRP